MRNRKIDLKFGINSKVVFSCALALTLSLLLSSFTSLAESANSPLDYELDSTIKMFIAADLDVRTFSEASSKLASIQSSNNTESFFQQKALEKVMHVHSSHPMGYKIFDLIAEAQKQQLVHDKSITTYESQGLCARNF